MKNHSMDILFEALALPFRSGSEDIPSDFWATLMYLAISYNKRGADMFFRYYFTEENYSEIAETYSLSRGRVRELVAKTAGHLRLNFRKELIAGLAKYNDKAIQQSYKDGYSKGYKEGMKQEQRERDKKVLDNGTVVDLGEEIVNLPLCQRTKTVLLRYGLETVKDIIEAGADKVKDYRNFGKKCYEELSSLLIEKYGEDKENWI